MKTRIKRIAMTSTVTLGILAAMAPRFSHGMINVHF